MRFPKKNPEKCDFNKMWLKKSYDITSRPQFLRGISDECSVSRTCSEYIRMFSESSRCEGWTSFRSFFRKRRYRVAPQIPDKNIGKHTTARYRKTYDLKQALPSELYSIYWDIYTNFKGNTHLNVSTLYIYRNPLTYKPLSVLFVDQFGLR